MKTTKKNYSNLLKSLILLTAFIRFSFSHAQITPDVLYLKFNEQPSTTGLIKNHATNASSYADSSKVIGLTIGGSSFCGTGLMGNGGRTTSFGVLSNAVFTNCAIDLNKSWSISMQVDGIIQPTLGYFFSSIGWDGFRCFSNGVAGAGNLMLRTNGWTLVVPNVADTMKHGVVFVHDADIKEIKAYEGGKFVKSYVYTDSLNKWTKKDTMLLAGYSTSTTINNGGVMDDFMIFSYAIDTTKLGDLDKGNATYLFNLSSCGDQVIAPNGRKFNKSGMYYDTLKGTGLECDSLITYNVKLFPIYRDTQVFSACGSFKFRGKSYNRTTTIIDSGKTVHGCDDIWVTQINISQTTSEKKQVTVCGSYITSKGIRITQSTTYFDTFTNSAGCDSIIIMDVIVNSNSLDTQNIRSCGLFINRKGEALYTNRSYTDSFINISGCDSLVFMNVVILPTTSDSQIVNVCDFYVNASGDTLRTSTTYLDTFTNVNGCDSIIKMIVNVTTIDDSVTENENTLTANQTNATYTWLDCNDNYAAIAGENQASYTPTENGSYAVSIDLNSCLDTSECILISGLSFNTLSKGDFTLSPNPNNGIFNINNVKNETFDVVIFDVNGRKCSYTRSRLDNGISIDMSRLPNGLYIVEITGSNTTTPIKVIKNR
jgi:hypothetical protein